MIHDIELTDFLGDLPTESFNGQVYRVTGPNSNPVASSTSGGRWAPSPVHDGSFPVIYTSFEPSGAISEVASYLGELTPIPRKTLTLHTISVSTANTLRIKRGNLSDFGIDPSKYGIRNYTRTQTIGAAINFMGYDGLIAPSARADCDNLILFMNNHSINEKLEITQSKAIDWPEWHEQIDTGSDLA